MFVQKTYSKSAAQKKSCLRLNQLKAVCVEHLENHFSYIYIANCIHRLVALKKCGK